MHTKSRSARRSPPWSVFRILVPLVLVGPGCTLPGKWTTVGQVVMKKQLERTSEVVAMQGRYTATLVPTPGLIRLTASRHRRCKAVLHEQVRPRSRWQSKRCQDGYRLAGMFLAGGALFAAAGGGMVGSGVAEDGAEAPDDRKSRGRLGGGATLLAAATAGLAAGFVEVGRQCALRRRCRTKRLGPPRLKRTPTTYPCGQTPLGGETLRVEVSLPGVAAGKGGGADEDDDDGFDDTGASDKIAYHPLTLKTDPSGRATFSLARVLAETFRDRLGDHLKITWKGHTQKVELKGVQGLARLVPTLLSVRPKVMVGAGFRYRVYETVIKKQDHVGRFTVRCQVSLGLLVTLSEGKGARRAWVKGSGLAAAALPGLLKGQPTPFTCQAGQVTVLQLLIPAGTAANVRFASRPPPGSKPPIR